MAQRVVLDDDIDGSPITEDGGTLQFAIDDTRMEIDLNQEHLKQFYDAVKPFIDNARVLRETASFTHRPIQAYRAKNTRPGDIRQWCREHGIPVNSMGRIPADIERRYEEANEPQPLGSRKQGKLQTVYKDPVLTPFSAGTK